MQSMYQKSPKAERLMGLKNGGEDFMKVLFDPCLSLMKTLCKTWWLWCKIHAKNAR